MANQQKSRIESLLSAFTEVKRGEGALALLMTLNIFLILTSYLIAKVLREPLILSGGGAEIKSYASALQVLVLIFVLRIYAAMVSKYPRMKLINYVTLFFVACMLLFYLGLITVGPWNGVLFYLWVGIFSLLVIAQFWSYANDIYTTEQGSRLFVLLAFGASAGGVFGPLLADVIIQAVGLYQLLLVSASLLVLSLFITNYINRRMETLNAVAREELAETKEPEMSREGAMKVVFQSRYLLYIAVLVLVANWVNTNGEYILGKVVATSADTMGDEEGRAFIGSFYSRFFTLVGFAGLVLQLFVVSRVLKYLGVRVAIMVLPIIALGTYGLIAAIPILNVIRWSKTAENATDYSLNNTVRQIIFLPTTKEEKYKAKVAIDSFFQRAGDVLSAGIVFLGVTWLGFGVKSFALFNLALTVVWLYVAFWIGKENVRLTAEKERESA